MAGEFGVLHDPATVVAAQQKVGEADELVGGEDGLIDDGHVGVGEGRVRRGDRRRDALGIRRPRLGQLDDPARVLLPVRVELAQFVLRAQPTGPSKSEIFGLGDGGEAPELRVDRTQPGELALGRGFQVARAPDDPRTPAAVFDVSHVTLPRSTLAAGCDTRRGATGAVTNGRIGGAGVIPCDAAVITRPTDPTTDTSRSTIPAPSRAPARLGL